MKKAMLSKCALYLFVLTFAAILNIADAAAPIVTPTPTITMAPEPIAIVATPITTPTPIVTPTPTTTMAPAPISAPAPIIFSSTINPIITPLDTPTLLPPIAPISPMAPLVPFIPATLPQINFQSQSTTIQPLAAAYQLAAIKAATTQASGTQSSSQTTAVTQINSSLANELQKANEELDIKHKKEYDSVIKDNIELLKEKETVLIQLHAQLKLQLETQKFAAQQRARAIKEMQEKLKQEEIKSKKDSEDMKLNVQSIVDLSPLVLNINQPKEKKKDKSDFDFTNLKNVQKKAKKCKATKHESDCKKRSSHCSWGRIPKQKKHKCLFMCEKLSKNHCKKVSGCYFKDHKCRNK